ncbi:MAG TPA: DEAD/DEAH box helicase [Verrucomicrobia bacterium]|nr:DEAD/DEAH box helicase [Verrucomicrobiota bacterium]
MHARFMIMTPFDEFPLVPALLQAIQEMGYQNPTAIQTAAIHTILQGHDLIATAPTGTGKTAAFSLPLLHQLITDWQRPRELRTRALILSPTRELALQLHQTIQQLTIHIDLIPCLIHGGVPATAQIQTLRSGTDLLIATPGRLIDLLHQKAIKLDETHHIVVDEADRMLDLGFAPDIRTLFEQLPAKRQALFISATMPPEAQKLAQDILQKPITLQLKTDDPFTGSIHHTLYYVEKNNKFALLEWVLNQHPQERTLIFCRTRRGADRLTERMKQAGLSVDVLHGEKSQHLREERLEQFRNADVPILISTDLAARGIHVDHISRVINFDLPSEAETFVHRIGRTARAGATGQAIHFCDPTERKYLIDIEKSLSTELPISTKQPFHSEQIKHFKGSAQTGHRPEKKRSSNNKKTIPRWQLSSKQTQKLHAQKPKTTKRTNPKKK